MVAPIRQTTDGEATMKLYMHPVSTVCRPIRLLCAENGVKIDEETVDLMTGAHHKEAYASLNPNRQVPLLIDGDLKLTEGSAILKYIAEKYQLPSYPADLKKRSSRTTSAGATKPTRAPLPGERRAQRSGWGSSTTTGSARPTSTCAETKSRLRTTSAPAWSRSVTSWVAI